MKLTLNRQFKHTHLLLVCTALANFCYLTHNFLGWAITLSFFLLIPGYLVIRLIHLPNISKWDLASLSVGLSILFIMLIGLIVNQLTVFGIKRPLSTINIFLALDLATVSLILLCSRLRNSDLINIKPLLKMCFEEYLVLSLASFLPVLCIFGAFRLNNGASDILTMVSLGLTALLFAWLVFRSNLERLNIPVLVLAALSILLAVSLRGWHITGHDIQTEFYVFQLTLNNQHWSMNTYKDAYNACVSLTILPTVLAKNNHHIFNIYI